MGILKHFLILRVRNVRFVIFLCLLPAIGNMTFAACWGCFILKGVRVEVTNGDMVSGYVRWNPEWFADNNEESAFPNSLFKSKYSKEWGDPFVIYREVYPIDKPFKDSKYFGKNFLFLVTSDADMVKIPLKELKDIRGEPKKHDGYSGAGEVPVFPMDCVKLMTDAAPTAVIVNDNDPSLELFISYNPNIGERLLKERFEEYKQGKWTSIESYLAELRRDKIILLEIAFD
jgi:hypothetical protein